MMKEINPSIEILSDYKNASTKVKVKCKIDGHEWEAKPCNLLYGFGCPVCGNKKSGLASHIPTEDKLKKLISMHNDIEFYDIPYLARDNVRCVCKKCGHEWYASYYNLSKQNSTGCPVCRESTGEKAITKILTKWGYEFIKQKKFNDLVDINYLFYDFYLTDYNTCIEYDGEQHYMLIRFGCKDENKIKENFRLVQVHDEMKNQYCKHNNIGLIRVPYWMKDDLEYYLFDEFEKRKIII